MKSIKTSILFIAVLFSSGINAQNYRTVVPNQKQFFEHDSTFNFVLNPPFAFPKENNSPIKVMYFDSSSTIQNGVSRFNFFTWRYSSPVNVGNCIDLNGASWMGTSMHELNNGNDLFFNENNDTIRIKTNAILNNSWHFFNYANGTYIKASVDSIVWMQKANILDSVKCISLNLFDSSGILNTTGYINGSIIYLSKSNGLLSTVIFREFPQNQQLIYRRNLVPMPTIGDIYNFDVNDEFEYYDFCGPNYNYIKIIAKNFSLNLDTVSYMIQHYRNSNPIVDTFNIIYSDCLKPFYNVLPEENNYSLPDSSLLNNYEISIDSNFNYKPIYINIDGYLFPRTQTDTCYIYNGFEPAPKTREYVAGLGLVESSSDYTLMMGSFCEEKLIWYHKGNTYWGTPMGLIIGLNNLGSSDEKIKLFPNPNSGIFSINLPENFRSHTTRIEIISILGELLYTEQIESNQLKKEMKIDFLKAGTYICKIISDELFFQQKIMVIK